MSAEISISMDPSAEVIAKQLSTAKALSAIKRGLDRGNELALGEILRSRFTGRGPFPVSEHRLGVRTNRLRSSMRRTRAAITGNEVSASIGSNVHYFGIHEFGFSGSVTVRAHRRRAPQADRFEMGESIISRAKAAELGAFDKRFKKSAQTKKGALQVSSGIAMVKAHQRSVKMPERAPLRTGIVSNSSIWQREILSALTEALEGGSK